MKLRWTAITCDAQRLLTKSQMWGKWWHATLLAGGWVGSCYPYLPQDGAAPHGAPVSSGAWGSVRPDTRFLSASHEPGLVRWFCDFAALWKSSFRFSSRVSWYSGCGRG